MEPEAKKPNRFLNTVSGLLQTLLVLLIVLVAGLFVASFFKIPGNIEIKIVKSGSMEPTIRTGGIVVIKPESSYSVGDIVTFGKDTKTSVPTTHRIVSMRQESGRTLITTKGDANEEADPQETAKESVIGRVLFSVPYAGYILDFAKQPIGFVLLIALPSGFIVLNELWAIWGEIKKIRFKKRKEEYFGEDEGEERNMPSPNMESIRRRRI